MRKDKSAHKQTHTHPLHTRMHMHTSFITNQNAVQLTPVTRSLLRFICHTLIICSCFLPFRFSLFSLVCVRTVRYRCVCPARAHRPSARPHCYGYAYVCLYICMRVWSWRVVRYGGVCAFNIFWKFGLCLYCTHTLTMHYHMHRVYECVLRYRFLGFSNV